MGWRDAVLVALLALLILYCADQSADDGDLAKVGGKQVVNILTWNPNDPVDQVTSYRVYGGAGSCTGQLVGPIAEVSGTTFHDSVPFNKRMASYQVTAVNAGGESDRSACVSRGW